MSGRASSMVASVMRRSGSTSPTWQHQNRSWPRGWPCYQNATCSFQKDHFILVLGRQGFHGHVALPKMQKMGTFSCFWLHLLHLLHLLIVFACVFAISIFRVLRTSSTAYHTKIVQTLYKHLNHGDLTCSCAEV